MQTGKRYPLVELLVWTKHETLYMTAVAAIPTALYALLGWRFEVPWVPVAMLGTASAFTVGFRNNATYARTWEARQVWGAIVNASRAWALMARDFPTPARAGDAAATLVHRHVAWLTALRYQLREARAWENMDRADNRRYARFFTIAEHDGRLADELRRLLGDAEADAVLGHANRATAIAGLQSAHLRALADAGALDEYRHVAMARQLAELLDQQGRCERIKNFPYPRQFATLNYWFIRLFVWLVPFGMLQEFRRLDEAAVWLTIPFSVVVTWIFLALEKVGESTENPFEGNANDVPITALARTIEIDMRQLLGEKEVPPVIAPMHSILT
ncbi:bestrophin family ion channel [Roseisolibacter sp. H3M3-2]|uniref:bestrophin family protein n=1 Tax=Roseisolibacter sp. H3M3-2 TaxID=3031323 RepID=UPI0023DBF88C|nr:bestrophin family ion channel [Roseisolibacter sp. H3M3-2]MDF1502481.1 bestrophin family ion channel [Roseisolibacter sp. H3M3-2]